MEKILEIDGSMGEGGGQIFRTALAYAAVIKKPIIIKNIRAKRENPGLRPQHLSALNALKMITKAKVKGDRVSSQTVYFEPTEIKGGNYIINPKTAGSITLIIQAILPALLFADIKSEVVIKGGTDVPMAPPIDAIRFTLFPFLNKIGLNVSLKLIRRGHYPRGGGEVKLSVEPTKQINSFSLTKQGEIVAIRGISHCVKLPSHVAKRQADSAKKLLKKHGFDKIEIEIESYPKDKDPHLGPGSAIVLWAETTTGALLEADSLGARGKPAEKVGEEAAMSLIKQIKNGGAIDIHTTDQLIPYMALARGISTIYSSEVSLHTMTAIEVAKKILNAKFTIENGLNKSACIKSEGINLTRNEQETL